MLYCGVKTQNESMVLHVGFNRMMGSCKVGIFLTLGFEILELMFSGKVNRMVRFGK